MIFELLVVFIAALSFSVIFNVSREELIFCGICGLASQGIYMLAENLGYASSFSVLCAVMAVSALSRILANVRKTPVTAYLLAGIIPHVPGSGMYRTALYIIASEYARAMGVGIETIKTAAAIAIGIFLIFSLPNKIFFKFNK